MVLIREFRELEKNLSIQKIIYDLSRDVIVMLDDENENIDPVCQIQTRIINDKFMIMSVFINDDMINPVYCFGSTIFDVDKLYEENCTLKQKLEDLENKVPCQCENNNDNNDNGVEDNIVKDNIVKDNSNDNKNVNFFWRALGYN